MCYKYRIHNMNILFTILRNALRYSEMEVKELPTVHQGPVVQKLSCDFRINKFFPWKIQTVF